jgi:hypothetical protein
MALLTNINGKFSVSDAGAIRFNDAFTFPTADGTANYFLQTNGSGQLGWAAAPTGSGATNRVAYWSTASNLSYNDSFQFDGSHVTITGRLDFAASAGTYGPYITSSDGDDVQIHYNGNDAGTFEIWNHNQNGGAADRMFKISDGSTSTFGSSSLDVNVEITGNIQVDGGFKDSSGDIGGAGQILSSTATGTNWINNSGGTVTGSGTGQKVTKWTGSGASTVLGDGPITFATNDSTFAGTGTFTDAVIVNGSYPGLTLNSTSHTKFAITNRYSSNYVTFDMTPQGGSTLEALTLKNNGFLGINRNSPNGLLHQQSAAGSNSEYYIQTGDTTTNSTIYFGDSDSSIHGGIDYDHNDDSMSFKVNNSFRMVINSSGLTTIKRTGITGVAKADMTLQIGYEGNNGQNNLIGFGYNAQTNIPAYIGYTTTSGSGSTKGDLVFGTRSVTTNTAPSERMRIDSDGNVGIGTTSPDLGAIAGTRVLTIASPTAERWGILELAGNRTWGGNQVGELKFISTDSTNNGTLVSLTAINDPTATGTGGSLKFSTRPNGGSLTERMRIKSDGVITFSTTAVTSTPAGSINHASNNFLYVTGGIGGASFGDDSHATRMIVFDNNYLRFDTGSTERMRIDSVGLATFRSTYIVAGLYGGEVTLGGSSTTFGLQLKYNQDAATTSTIYHSPGYVSNDNSFKLGSGSGNTNQLVLKGDGNVGIGTSTPGDFDGESRNLVIRGGVNGSTPTIGMTIATDGNQASSGRCAIRFADGINGNERYRGAVEYNHNGDDMSFRTAGTQKMRIDSGGSILIGAGATSGTPTSDYRSLEIGRQGNTITGAPWKSNLYLTCNGTVTAGSTAFTYRYANEAPARMDLEDGNVTFYNAAAGTVGDTISWNQRMIVNSSGNVGIGDTSAPNKLSVKDTGNLTCRFTGGTTFSLYQNNTDGSVIFSANHGNASPTGVEKRFIWQLAGGTAKMKLDDGNLTVSGDVVAYGSPSDKRLKENIKPIESALDKVEKLQGVTFDWKDKKQDKAYDPDQAWKEDIGFIAQDVQKVIPELVRENDNGMLSMRHQGIAPILLEAIKELKAEIEELKKQIK